MENRFTTQKIVCLFYISVHCIHIAIDLACDKTVRKSLQLFYYNCQSNHDCLIGVLSPHNSNRGDTVMDSSCSSKWGQSVCRALTCGHDIVNNNYNFFDRFNHTSPLLFWLYYQYLNSNSICLSVLAWQWPLIYICMALSRFSHFYIKQVKSVLDNRDFWW